MNPWLDLLDLLSPEYFFTIVGLWLAIELLFPPTHGVPPHEDRHT